MKSQWFEYLLKESGGKIEFTELHGKPAHKSTKQYVEDFERKRREEKEREAQREDPAFREEQY